MEVDGSSSRNVNENFNEFPSKPQSDVMEGIPESRYYFHVLPFTSMDVPPPPMEVDQLRPYYWSSPVSKEVVPASMGATSYLLCFHLPYKPRTVCRSQWKYRRVNGSRSILTWMPLEITGSGWTSVRNQYNQRGNRWKQIEIYGSMCGSLSKSAETNVCPCN